MALLFLKKTSQILPWHLAQYEVCQDNRHEQGGERRLLHHLTKPSTKDAPCCSHGRSGQLGIEEAWQKLLKLSCGVLECCRKLRCCNNEIMKSKQKGLTKEIMQGTVIRLWIFVFCWVASSIFKVWLHAKKGVSYFLPPSLLCSPLCFSGSQWATASFFRILFELKVRQISELMQKKEGATSVGMWPLAIREASAVLK